MQIATLRYQVNPKDKVISDARARLRYRQTLAITNPQKKPKQRQSLASKLSAHTNGAFPPIKKNSQHRNSIRINGSSLASSKIGEIYPSSLRHASRPPSRRSSKSEYRDGRSGSVCLQRKILFRIFNFYIDFTISIIKTTIKIKSS
jgi:hypothetical protein